MVKIIPKLVINSVRFDHWNNEVKIDISPTKFGDGGKAMFISAAISHQAAVRGKIIWVPWRRINVRVWERS